MFFALAGGVIVFLAVGYHFKTVRRLRIAHMRALLERDLARADRKSAVTTIERGQVWNPLADLRESPLRIRSNYGADSWCVETTRDSGLGPAGKTLTLRESVLRQRFTPMEGP